MSALRSIVTGAAALTLCAASWAQSVEPGYVQGTVRDNAGNPLSGVVIFIDGVLDQNMQYTTREDGAYRIRLQPGAYRALASMSRQYEGMAYKVDLKPDSTDTFDDAEGAVRNFTWALTGDKVAPDMGSFGGFIYVDVGYDPYFVEDPEYIIYTLTPVGPLIDGSAGAVITRQGGIPRSPEYGKLLDIPVGKYTVTGIYQPPGMKPQTLKFVDRNARKKVDAVESLEFVLLSEGNFCNDCASLGIEGIQPPQPE